MTFDALLALLPIITTAAAAVVVMMGIAVNRSHSLTVALTLAGLLVAFVMLPVSSFFAPIEVTPLVIIDRYAIFFSGLIIASSIVVTLLCYSYFRRRDTRNEELYLLLLIAVLGALVVVSSRHFASFFIGLETLSVSLFAMVAYTVRNELSLEAGFKYLVLSGVSSSFLLFGSALMYAELGTFVFADMGMLAAISDRSVPIVIGLAMVITGLGFKLSLVPFHLWTSDVYQGAPAPVTAFVATVSKGAIIAFLLRYLTMTGAFQSFPVTVVFGLLAIVSILVGNLLALQQNDVKRILAYSSIAHMGYLMIPFVAGAIIGSVLIVEAVTFYLVAYFVTTLGAFGMVAVLSGSDQECSTVDHFQGLFWQKPLLAAVFTSMLLSLAGIPLTAGFIGKFYIFATGVHSALWLLMMVLIVGSGIGLYYYLRVIIAMLKPPQTQVSPSIVGSNNLEVGHMTLVGLAILLIYWGVFPASLTDLIHDMARIFSM